MTDDRPPVAVTGVSGTVSSGGAAGSWKDSRACSAVVRMAWNSSSLTLCRLESPAAVPRAPEMPSPSWVCVSSAGGSPSCARFFPALSPDEGSTIGHTKPVRGVYAGLWERRMSREFCNDCRDVSYYRRRKYQRCGERAQGACTHKPVRDEGVHVRGLIYAAVEDKVHG